MQLSNQAKVTPARIDEVGTSLLIDVPDAVNRPETTTTIPIEQTLCSDDIASQEGVHPAALLGTQNTITTIDTSLTTYSNFMPGGREEECCVSVEGITSTVSNKDQKEPEYFLDAGPTLKDPDKTQTAWPSLH